ncbi:MAG: DinB family protein [Candidatus Acidiferrum sp.]
MNNISSRRNFLKAGAAIAAGVSGFALSPQPTLAQDNESWVIGPTKGYTPEIGTLVSMLNFTRMQVLHNVKGLSQSDLDFLLDAKANTIGSLLLHLAATETYYGLNSFGGMQWESWSEEVKKKWDIPMNLDEPARKAIKGNSLDYYLNALHESREKNLAEFKKRDDKWLAEVDTYMGMNNYGKWFHVAEHESNHDGQIKFLKGRLPGAKTTGNS